MLKLKRTVGCLLLGLVLLTSCQKEVCTADYNVIPLPKTIEQLSGASFHLNNETTVVYAEGNNVQQKTAELLVEYLRLSTGLNVKLSTVNRDDNAILLATDYKHENREAYNLTITDKLITISGASDAGSFYGIQTLIKSIGAGKIGSEFVFPQVSVTDYPRFAYRGMMLDVGRHFTSVEFVKKYIDILALHNVNTFHWHLTEDQGWRIEIKKYPRLTEVGSIRSESTIGKNTGEFDGTPHGGFYTQEEAKEVVAYAAERFITVIPEFDLPGHMLAALTAYPEYGCTGGPYEVSKEWGVFDAVLCVGNDKSMEFLKDVFAELIEIFPSEYIHVGGDECPKTRWEKCPKCQAKIRQLGLKADKKHSAEERLQSYCISTVEKFLNSKGRQIIGWDEILEGGLAPNATVMAWRSMNEGVKAAKLKHNVVMAPVDYCYFDYYQTRDIENPNTPFSIGGYLPLEKVYSLEPVPMELNEEEKQYVIGGQANLWTEYIKEDSHREYMLLPRLTALSEVLWSKPEQKDYDNFLKRLPTMFSIYDKLGINYAKVIYNVDAEFASNQDKSVVEVKLHTFDNAPIYYTLDSSEPTKNSSLYENPIAINSTLVLKAVAIRSEAKSDIYSQNFYFSKSTLKPITVNYAPIPRHTYGGIGTLVDGRRGTNTGYANGSWIGFQKEDPVEFVIDLGKDETVSSVKIGTYIYADDWIFGSTGLIVEVSSDGKKYERVAKNSYFEITKQQVAGRVNIGANFKEKQTRYVKVTVQKTRKMPAWHQDAGKVPCLFLDEIQID